MAKQTHRPRQRSLSRGVFLVVVGLAMAVLLIGFVSQTRTAMRFQAEGPPGAEHPYDWQAWGCLSGALILLGVLSLSRPAPRRWRKTPKCAQNPGRSASKAAKRRRRSGYNRANDT